MPDDGQTKIRERPSLRKASIWFGIFVVLFTLSLFHSDRLHQFIGAAMLGFVGNDLLEAILRRRKS